LVEHLKDCLLNEPLCGVADRPLRFTAARHLARFTRGAQLRSNSWIDASHEIALR
jgi:hypothetical protein